MHHLKIPYFKQDLPYSCGPACLQMVFAYYKKRMSEAELTRELRSNDDVGTTPGRMIAITRKHGFFCYVNNNASLAEIEYFLRLEKPVIVYFVEPTDEDDHYAVVSGMGKKKIFFNDSWNGKGFSLSVSEFERRWHGKKKYHTSLRRWLLVVSPEEIPMGRQYKPMSEIFRNFI